MLEGEQMDESTEDICIECEESECVCDDPKTEDIADSDWSSTHGYSRSYINSLNNQFN
jgi:hypothetical protein